MVECYAVIRFKNGAVGMIEVSTVCRGMNSQTLDVIGTKGHICADLERMISFDVEGHSPPALEPDEDLFTLLIADFIESILNSLVQDGQGWTGCHTTLGF